MEERQNVKVGKGWRKAHTHGFATGRHGRKRLGQCQPGMAHAHHIQGERPSRAPAFSRRCCRRRGALDVGAEAAVRRNAGQELQLAVDFEVHLGARVRQGREDSDAVCVARRAAAPARSAPPSPPSHFNSEAVGLPDVCIAPLVAHSRGHVCAAAHNMEDVAVAVPVLLKCAKRPAMAELALAVLKAILVDSFPDAVPLSDERGGQQVLYAGNGMG